MGGVPTFEELLEAKKKAMKKKMDFGGDDEEGDEEGDEEEDDNDAETGDGEVVDASSDKDEPEEDGSDEAQDGEDEDMNNSPALMRMKKKMGKMKKKMSADTKKKPKSEATEQSEQDDAWWQSVHDMMGKPKDRNFDGLNYVDGIQHEDSLLPHIDPNTGMIVNTDEPRPGEVGYAPNSRFGIGN